MSWQSEIAHELVESADQTLASLPVRERMFLATLARRPVGPNSLARLIELGEMSQNDRCNSIQAKRDIGYELFELIRSIHGQFGEDYRDYCEATKVASLPEAMIETTAAKAATCARVMREISEEEPND